MRQKKLSLAHCRAISRGLRGHKFAASSLAKMSASRKGKKATPKQLEHILELADQRRGYKHSEETKRKIGVSNRGKKRTAAQVAVMVKHRLGRVYPYRDSKIEVIVRKFLRGRDVKFRQHALLRGSTHRFDFVLPDHCLVVECDGCYWHVCSRHCPKKKGDWRVSQCRRDLANNRHARKKGFVVVRLWEHDIRAGRLRKLEKALQEAA